MSIRSKVIIITTSSLLSLIFITSMIFYFSYFGYINKQQQQQINQNFDTINYLIQNQEDTVKNILLDWSKWDDTYNFINDQNTQYINSNLEGDVLDNLNLDSMVFLNNQNQVIYTKNSEKDDEKTEDLVREFFENNNNSYSINSATTGLLPLDDKVYIIATSPVTLSNDTSKHNGSLMLIKEIDQKTLDYMEKVSHVTINFKNFDQEINKPFMTTNETISIYHSNENIESNRLLTDVHGENSILLNIESKFNNYTDMIHFFKIFIIGFLFIIAIIILCDYIISNKYIFKRLSKLNKFVENVTATKNTNLSINMSGNDEIYKLSTALNTMLSELHLAYEDIKGTDERFRLLMEATNDGYLDCYVKTKEMYINPTWATVIGCDNLDKYQLYKEYTSKIHPDYLDKVIDSLTPVINGELDYFTCEYKLIKPSGNTLWVLHRGKTIEKDKNNKPLRVISTLTDITDLKNYEEKILFLSYSDKLTGLKNRAYMEKEFVELNNNPNSNYHIIMGDVNGLKLANDALGHKEGDKLLCIVSKILTDNCADDDIISRWGGDEYIILVKNKNENYVFNLIDKIKNSCQKVSEFHFKISIALGCAKKDYTYLLADDVMKLAEERMYRHKLLENRSARSATINSLLKTLHEKDTETEEHTIRIKNLSLRLGKRLNLTQDKLDELELLSSLHDIGKIGIPDQILMKPSELTNEEWAIMKTHTDIGYRIANSTPELAHISTKILAHHEKYDGTGYPNGLKGEEIPLLSRIINIVDSFDVMTHKRVYKDALSKEYVINELTACAGNQFDPNIVEEFLAMLKEDNFF